ncbi:hypothetical protein F4778DRAFT_787623 [Xylariomycetidae sp. FL2044]|nr:hypothetical protein F4778DRAFT_787623 [Xylariomycetidae sp. FL2044]
MECTRFEGDPSDSGVAGIILPIVFAGSAGIALMSLLLQYLFIYDLLRDDDNSPNAVDLLFLGRFRKALRLDFGSRTTPEAAEGWLKAAFDRCILIMGDVQLGMGIALLIHGYVALFGGLSIYRWWLTLGLVWFSVITNLAARSFLRSYHARRPGTRAWRLILLVCLICVLAFSMIPTARVKRAIAEKPEEVTEILGSSALCYLPWFGSGLDTGDSVGAAMFPAVYIVGTMCVMLIVFAALRLYEIPDGFISRWYRNYRGLLSEPADDGPACPRCEQRAKLLVVRPFIALWLALRVYADLINSIGAQVFCLMALMAWVAVRFFSIRNLGPAENTVEWSHEQILALVLFVAPLEAVLDSVYGIFMGRRRAGGTSDSNKSRVELVPQRLGWLHVIAVRRNRLLGRLRAVIMRRNDYEPLIDDEAPSSESENGASTTAAQGIQETAANGVGIEQHQNDIRQAFNKAGRGAEYQFYFRRPWPAFALPIVVTTVLLHAALLLILPLTANFSPAEIFLLAAPWAMVYAPLLVFVYFLGSMIVEERSRSRERAQKSFRFLCALATALSFGAIMDTVFGLGGLPMSYLALGALGLLLTTYLFFGLVARTGQSAKRKGRAPPTAHVEDQDLEEGGVAAERNDSNVSNVRRTQDKGKGKQYPVFPEASARLLSKKAPGYGTMAS